MKHRRRPRTLFHRIYLHGAALLFLVAVTLAAAGFLLGRGAMWRVHPERMAQQVASRIAPLPEEALPGALARIAADQDLDLAVFSEDGRQLASAGRSREADPDDPPGPLRFGRRTFRPGSLSVAVPAGTGRYLRVWLRGSDRALLLRALAVLGLVVLVVAVASAPLARAIARPLEDLSRAARRLGEGDLAARAHLRRDDEIGELGRTFDEMAERLGRLLEGQRELLANVSHELRTPMARIRVALDLAAEAGPDDARRFLREIEGDLSELERLVADLLTTSRLDAGGALVLRRESLDPQALVEAALARFRRHHPGRTLEDRLEPVPRLLGEAGLLDRVLDNLLDNAAKYSEPGTPVGVALRPAEGGVAFEVRDRGIGIAPEDQARVFTPFFRTDRSRARDTGGVGLGLALSKRIVEAHRGQITLLSQPGEGTTVRVFLPLS